MDDVPQRCTDVEARAKGSTPTARLATQALRYACSEIGLMEGVLRPWVDPLAVQRLRDMVYSVLTTVATLASQGKVHPMPRLRLGPEDPPGARIKRRLRLGVFPISANPLHWMHLGAGLLAIAKLHLDSVVYIIAGDDPRKPGLLRADVRHPIAQEMLRPFAPFFRYSPIALGSDLPGEENLFRLLSLNPDQPIDAHYLAGSDHYQRLCPTSGAPDTIQRLEDGVRNRIYGYRPGVHSVSAAFLDRGIPGSACEDVPGRDMDPRHPSEVLLDRDSGGPGRTRASGRAAGTAVLRVLPHPVAGSLPPTSGGGCSQTSGNGRLSRGALPCRGPRRVYR